MNPTRGWAATGIAIFAAVGGMSGFLALLNLGLTRARTKADTDSVEATADKTQAETVKVLTETAAALIEPLRRQVAELTGRVHTLETYQRIHNEVLSKHAVWDAQAVARSQTAGVTLPSPPPLYPPDDHPALEPEPAT